MNRPEHLPSSLTDEQVEAITDMGRPLLIIAGPGSGKTEVISWRVAHLVKSGHAQPRQFLVTTFTNRAAHQLKDRIQQKLPGLDAERVHASTIHSFCADVLREFQTRSPLPRGFHILDEEGQFLFVYVHRKDLGLDAFVKGRLFDFFEGVLRMYNLATEELVDSASLLEWCQQQCRRAEAEAAEAAGGRSKTRAKKAESQAQHWAEAAAVADSYASYCEMLRDLRLVDFAFLQKHTLELLETHAEIAQDVAARYPQMLIDEYQDTNAAQERILKILAGDGRGLTVVGDDDQSIYRFRGATVKNLLTFEERYPGAHQVRLSRNFRSLEAIVEHSVKLIAHNPARFAKDLFTMRGKGSDVVLVYERTVAEEAAALAGLLRRLHDEGKIRRWGDVAVLLRSVRSYASDYLEAFANAGIPVFVTGSSSFFEREDISQLYDLIHFLGASKPWGDIHVRSPLMNLNPATCAALETYKENLTEIPNEDGLKEIGVESAEDRRRLLDLIDLKRRVQKKQHSSFLEVLYDLLAITGYAEACEKADQQEALMNLGVLSRLVASFDEYGGTRRIYPFQDYLELMRRGGVDPAILRPEDAVEIMTIHQAKGLEFPVVVVPSVLDGRLPVGRRRVPYPVPHELCASGCPELPDPDELRLADERKLFYVAATRARELLIIGTADLVRLKGGGPSPFLEEMFGEELSVVSDLSRRRIEEASSADRPPQPPRERINFSQLAFYLQCPGRFRYAVIYGLEVERPDPVDFGANVHRALLAIHEQARASHAPSAEDVEAIVEESWVPSLQADPTQDRQAKKAAIEQLRTYVARHVEDFGRVKDAEIGFSFGMVHHVLSGKIDLVRTIGQGMEIVDFKTGKSGPAALEQVDTQLDVYAMGAERYRGLPVTKRTVHFLEDDAVYSSAWSFDLASEAERRIGDILGRIRRRDLPPRPDYCRRCQEFRRICPHARR